MPQYSVLIIPEPEEGGYSVHVPMLPGLHTQGDSYEEALANARAAIVFHLECLQAEGEPIPGHAEETTTTEDGACTVCGARSATLYDGGMYCDGPCKRRVTNA